MEEKIQCQIFQSELVILMIVSRNGGAFSSATLKSSNISSPLDTAEFRIRSIETSETSLMIEQTQARVHSRPL